MTTMTIESIYRAVGELVNNEILHPARREDFRYCCQVWSKIFKTTIEFVIPVVQLGWDVGCEIAWWLAIETIHLSKAAAERVEYWWQHQREPQMAVMQAWMERQKPKLQAFWLWLAACYAWLIEPPEITEVLVADEGLLLPAAHPMLLLSAAAEVVVAAAGGGDGRLAIVEKATRNATKQSRIRKKTNSAADTAIRKSPLTANALKKMRFKNCNKLLQS